MPGDIERVDGVPEDGVAVSTAGFDGIELPMPKTFLEFIDAVRWHLYVPNSARPILRNDPRHRYSDVNYFVGETFRWFIAKFNPAKDRQEFKNYFWKAIEALTREQFSAALPLLNDACAVVPVGDSVNSLNFCVASRCWAFVKCGRPTDALSDFCLASHLKFPPEREYLRLELSGKSSQHLFHENFHPFKEP